MYESFYQLSRTPFRLTPDPHFFFESVTHKRGLAYLRFAFYQQEGFVVITGAPGTGKTELMLNLINEMPRDKVTMAKIVTSNLEADDLLDLVAASFLINPDQLSKGSILKRLEDYFISQSRRGKQVLLLIDEAHNLSVNSLIELSMLSNFQIGEKPVVQCFLLGQEPLENKLNLPELVHLKQRVIASTHLETLNPLETRNYILHRLDKSGWKNNPIIRDTAFALIHIYSKGVPRKINSLCNRIFLQAFLDNRNDIGADLVHQIIEELQDEFAEEHTDLDVDFAGLQETVDQVSATDNKRENNKPADATINKAVSQNDLENVINIPEFIRKKETRQPKPFLPATTVHPHSGAFPTNTSLTESPPDKPQISVVVNQAHDMQGTRPSGLLDKELKFLASLNETSEIPKIETQPDETPSPKAEKPDKQAEPPPEKKVIIDPSVYESNVDAAGDNVDPVTSDIKEKPKSKQGSKIHNGLYSATVFVILIGMGFSVYWWQAGDTNSIDIAASIASVTNSKANSPSHAAPDKLTRTLPGNADNIIAGTSSITDTSGIATSETELQTAPQSTTETTTQSKTDQLSGNRDKLANTLEQQFTAVLEKPVASTTKPSRLSTRSLDADPIPADRIKQAKRSKSKQTIASDDKIALDNAVSLNTNEKGEHSITATAIQNPQAVTDGKAPDIPDDDKFVSNLKLAATPLVGSPVTEISHNKLKTYQPAKHSVKTYSTAGIANKQSEPEQAKPKSKRKPKVTPFISNNDLHQLLFRLSSAYEMGNLQQLMGIFASNIYSHNGADRNQLENEYQRLFDITDTRRLAISGVKWLPKNNQMLGNGDFQVLIREKGATSYTTYEGKIRFTVARESDNIVIKRLDYEYNN